MTTDRHRRAKEALLKAVGSFVVIVVGVLVALAGDAWWKDREVAARQHAYLMQLQADLAAIAGILDESIATNHKSARASLDLAATLLGADSWAELPDSVSPHFATDDVRFPVGTLTALLATGDINDIAPDSLKAGLIAYGATIEWARSFVSVNDAALWANFCDYERAEQELYEGAANGDLKRRLTTMAPTEALRQFDLRVLDGYPEIQAAFRLRGLALQNRNYVLCEVAASTGALLRMLDVELGGTR